MSTIQAKATWKGSYETWLEDGRGHSVGVDLPHDEGGSDTGTSALELQVLSLAGCISTIFALVAKRRRLRYQGLTIELEAHRPRGAPTVTAVNGTFTIESDDDPGAIDTSLQITVRTCPVGVIYEKAGIPVSIRTVVRPMVATAQAERSGVPAGNGPTEGPALT
ncbi:MAG: OsmC family protein [Euryarchaeota archaeon]|nr:OsmC family protein [Euryarchaeota archaeon]MDE1837117.1 OsmC family protein [Euryarchaeota archaeon]MDE1879671.1 OsmC family protein [Euryarchaeota archaeon]MDE2045197.1 OsmC family protein [Thermoplasmata archaeon]